MRKLALVASLSVLWCAGALVAQDVEDRADAQRPDERPALRVLENPYDIASFYRSSQAPSYGYFAENPGASRYPIAGFYRSHDAGPYGYSADDPASRYPIAGFYRSHDASPYGYSRFWTNGYSYGRPLRTVAVPYGRYAHRIGQNGDLLLLAPTFLAPVGPLTGVFFGDGR